MAKVKSVRSIVTKKKRASPRTIEQMMKVEEAKMKRLIKRKELAELREQTRKLKEELFG